MGLNKRFLKFFSYYKPYLGLFFADMICAFLVAGITLALPLLARHLTQHVLGEPTADRPSQVYLSGAVMLALVGVQTLCNMVVDYQGHLMGALMESDLRAELFAHYQGLSFRFTMTIKPVS